MGLLSKLKSVLGLGADDDGDVGRRSGDVGVTVERERDDADAENEAAVKGVDTTESTDESTDADEAVHETGEDATGADTSGDAVDATADEEAVAADDETATDATTADGTTTADDETTTDDSTEEPGEEPVAAAGEDVQDIKGIGPAYADRLADVGIETVAELAAADHEAVAEEADLAPGRVKQWVDRAKARQ